MISPWYSLLTDLLAYMTTHEAFGAVLLEMGPEPEIPQQTTVRLTRGTQQGDPTLTADEQRLTVYVECWEVSAGDYLTRNGRLAELEAAAFAAVRDWRLERERVPGVRHKAHAEALRPDGGAFLPHALASRSEITISWMERPT